MLTNGSCPKIMLSIRDALEALEGRWKLLILFSLSAGPRRFKQIAREVNGITDKTLSRELKNLEASKLIKRDVYNTFPPTVEYSITANGRSLEREIGRASCRERVCRYVYITVVALSLKT